MAARELMFMEGLRESAWWLANNQSDLETNGNNCTTTVNGEPLWIGRANFTNMNPEKMRALKAWINRRQGALYTFTAPHPIVRTPLLNPSQSNSGITLSSVNIGASSLALAGLSANPRAGDMVSYRTLLNGYWVGEISDDATHASGVATVFVNPAPMAKHATTPALRLFEPLGEFQLVGAPQINEQATKLGSASFNFKQFIE